MLSVVLPRVSLVSVVNGNWLSGAVVEEAIATTVSSLKMLNSPLLSPSSSIIPRYIQLYNLAVLCTYLVY